MGNVEAVSAEVLKGFEAQIEATATLRKELLVQGQITTAKEVGLLVHCLKLTRFQYGEMMRAWQGHAYCAAAIFGAAALESFLLMTCLLSKEAVMKLPKYAQLGADKRAFLEFLDKMDLGKLLEIAKILHWFPEGVFLEA